MATIGAFMGAMVPVAAVGIVLFFVMAIVAEAKGGSRGNAIRTAFSYAVSLVMLLMIVSTAAYLLQQGLRAWVFTDAQTSTSYYSMNMPPTVYLATDKGMGMNPAYACTDSCQFTDADTANFTTWKDSYRAWQKQNTTTGRFTETDKRDMVTALSFLIVALPLFWWFFMRMVQREHGKLVAQGQKKPTPLRASYYYLLAFGGLIAVVVSGALLINLGLRKAIGVSDSQNTPIPSMVSSQAFDQNGVKSIIACADKCGFTAEDKALAEQWLTDYDTYQKNSITAYPRVSSTQTDLSNLIPIFLVAVPVFLYHFIIVRRESADDSMPPASSTPIS